MLERDKKLGLGSAYVAGFRFALSRDFDSVIQMDADLSHDPGFITALLAGLRDADLVIGSRYVKGGYISGWPGSRLFLSRWANIYARCLTNVPVYDLTSGFKALSIEVLKRMDFHFTRSKGYAFQIEIVCWAVWNGFSVIELPIEFKGRQGDRSKMSLGIIVEAFSRVVGLFVYRTVKGCKNNSAIRAV